MPMRDLQRIVSHKQPDTIAEERYADVFYFAIISIYSRHDGLYSINIDST